MNFVHKLLVALGLMEKAFEHIVSPAKTMVVELEQFAQRRRDDVAHSANAIKDHEEVIDVASKAAVEAETVASKFRALITA